MDEFDESLEELHGNEPGQIPAPTWRATIRRGRLMLTDWAPWLIRTGPLGSLFPERERDGITIADLTVHGEDEREISVRFHALGADREQAEQLLLDWAAGIGYRRVWLADRLVTLEPDPERIGTASVRCPTCRARWSDSTPEFWLTVKRGGMFPKWCPMCGCELPQWTVLATRRTRGGRTATREGSKSSDRRSRSHSRPKPR